jgi:hypothetical protein
VTYTYTRTFTGLPGGPTTFTAEPYTPASLRASSAGGTASSAVPLVTSTGFGGGIGGSVSGGGTVGSAASSNGGVTAGAAPLSTQALPSLA